MEVNCTEPFLLVRLPWSNIEDLFLSFASASLFSKVGLSIDN
jgi:hypothetical protein